MKQRPEDFVQVEERLALIERKVAILTKLVGHLAKIAELQQEQLKSIHKIEELKELAHKIGHPREL